ncbi:MAG: MgtC/SapB family protein [Clostridia bacterium]|nr:MgtC/SapB family protein [Clostridia bacterium]
MEEIIAQLWFLIDILISAFLGFLIGLERKKRFKEAGIRTHTLVSIGACLMMIISINAFGPDADAARVAAQIVSGVGFLGAGIIIYRKQEIKGLTTAAGVWATAGVGMACGGRLYIVAIGATLIMIGIQLLFHLKIKPFKTKKYFSVNIVFLQIDDANKKIKEMFGVDRFNHLNIKRDGENITYSATLNTDKELSSTQLDKIMRENDFIYSIERCDDN